MTTINIKPTNNIFLHMAEIIDRENRLKPNLNNKSGINIRPK